MLRVLNVPSFCICLMALLAVLEATQDAHLCRESKCGDQDEGIYFPFRSGNEQQMVLLKFFVKQLDYKNQEIQLHNPYCLMLKPLEVPNMPISPFFFRESDTHNFSLLDCPVDKEGSGMLVPCLGSPGHRVYAIYSEEDTMYSWDQLFHCTKMYDVFSVPNPINQYIPDEFRILHLEWKYPNCTECEAEGKKCRIKYNGTKTEIECVHLTKASELTKFVATGATLGSFVLLLLTIVAYRVYSSDRKEKDDQLKIEQFLDDYRALKPSRYSYADLKRITNQFEDKLGQGAYGTVFKGQLSSELFVAVKVLNSSKGDGEEFINEVGTMGHIHHVNVVRLVGFCADGFKRALVYEYFSNGSLQDFISSAYNNDNAFLGWDKLQGIAVAIAKGIDYLHHGCDQRILHFDIKPHNILLDQNFTPKISDFGLAKLCSKDQSVVSMTTARGTIGYISPEVFSRNFGNVSYKSDVYSFGMLLLEMVGGRKNIDSAADNTTEIYFPEWIYNLLEGGDDLRIHIEDDGDGKIPKKLAIVGLWCIQWNPAGRPSMKAVVQMLEGEESLTVPPNPFSSAGAARTNASMPARNLNIQLETIDELE